MPVSRRARDEDLAKFRDALLKIERMRGKRGGDAKYLKEVARHALGEGHQAD